MLLLLLAGLASAGPLPCGTNPEGAAGPPGAVADSLERLYARGQSFAEFLAAVKSRAETWTGNYANAVLPPALLEQAHGLPGRWRLLVVAEDWCGDSANTLPYVARLVDSVGSLELRIVNSTLGRFVMDRYRTPDGRAATPIFVVLDSLGAAAGCFVERPAALTRWLDEHRMLLSESELTRGRDEWRRQDAGRETLREVVEVLVAVAAGTPRCGKP